jgi:hypothetical protein
MNQDHDVTHGLDDDVRPRNSDLQPDMCEDARAALESCELAAEFWRISRNCWTFVARFPGL